MNSQPAAFNVAFVTSSKRHRLTARWVVLGSALAAAIYLEAVAQHLVAAAAQIRALGAQARAGRVAGTAAPAHAAMPPSASVALRSESPAPRADAPRPPRQAAAAAVNADVSPAGDDGDDLRARFGVAVELDPELENLANDPDPLVRDAVASFFQ
jgi:hypothetical protein